MTGEEWLKEKLGLQVSPHFRALTDERNGQIVRAVGYDNWTGSSCEMHWGGHTWTPRFLAAAFYFAFVEEDCKVVLCSIADEAKESLELVPRLGFIKVASICDGHPSGYLHIFALRRENCKLLRRYYHA